MGIFLQQVSFRRRKINPSRPFLFVHLLDVVCNTNKVNAEIILYLYLIKMDLKDLHFLNMSEGAIIVVYNKQNCIC